MVRAYPFLVSDRVSDHELGFEETSGLSTLLGTTIEDGC
jgi:hypothetical protein